MFRTTGEHPLAPPTFPRFRAPGNLWWVVGGVDGWVGLMGEWVGYWWGWVEGGGWVWVGAKLQSGKD